MTNTGALTMSNIAVTDPKAGPVTCPQPTLAPADSETCTADSLYTVTAADVTAGAVVNTATASGSAGPGYHAHPVGAVVHLYAHRGSDPAVAVVKTANASGGDTDPLTAGEPIKYSYLVTNTGNDDLTTVAVSDPTLGAVDLPDRRPARAWPPARPNPAPPTRPTPSPKPTWTPARSRHRHRNRHRPHGLTSARPRPISRYRPDRAAAPAVAIDKTATVAPAADQDAAKAGDTIAYTYMVTNTGNVTLASVAVNDPSLGTVTCPTPASPGLAPGRRKPAPPSDPTPLPRPTGTPAKLPTPPPQPAPTRREGSAGPSTLDRR